MQGAIVDQRHGHPMCQQHVWWANVGNYSYAGR